MSEASEGPWTRRRLRTFRLGPGPHRTDEGWSGRGHAVTIHYLRTPRRCDVLERALLTRRTRPAAGDDAPLPARRRRPGAVAQPGAAVYHARLPVQAHTVGGAEGRAHRAHEKRGRRGARRARRSHREGRGGGGAGGGRGRGGHGRAARRERRVRTGAECLAANLALLED